MTSEIQNTANETHATEGQSSVFSKIKWFFTKSQEKSWTQ